MFLTEHVTTSLIHLYPGFPDSCRQEGDLPGVWIILEWEQKFNFFS